jgi:hypothetical protein
VRLPIALRIALPALVAAVPLAAAPAFAQDVPSDLSRLELDTGRVDPKPAEADKVRLQFHGEYQLRYEHLRSFPLDATASTAIANPGVVAESLGQNDFAYHWLRFTPRLQIGNKLEVVGQMDVVTGVAVGDTARDSYADQWPRDSYDGLSNVQPRWLYVEWLTPIGLLRAGQQPSHWGMGLVANDGDHPSLFGDYRYGNIVEQVLFATRPFGEKSPFVVALAGNLVYRDNVATLVKGDRAWQGILAAFYEQGPDMLGFYGVYRHQSTDRTSGSSYFPFADTIDVGVLDFAGRFARPAPFPERTGYVYGAFEAATELGTTSAERTAEQVTSGDQTKIRAYGGAVQAGFVLADYRDKGDGASPAATADEKARPDLYGRIVAQVELGYASGDADPYDDTEHRFVMDPNHKVGLLLFDEVTRWQTARAAVAAQDPNLGNGSRPPPGVGLLPSNGGVFGAEYLYPTVVYRPRPWFDVKVGGLVAQTTADYVDAYRVATQGAYVNYNGGDPKRHDLGLETDVGVEARFNLDYGLRLQVGAQGAVLFPGGALADASGSTIKTPWITVVRAGLQY